MRSPRRFGPPLLSLAFLAACATARPTFVMRPVNDGVLNPGWPEVLRTRYQCENAVVGAALRAVRTGHAFESRFPVDSDVGAYVCDLAGVMWPVRVRAFATVAGLVEEWEFQGPRPAEGRPAISANVYQAGSVFFEGPTPHLLRLVR